MNSSTKINGAKKKKIMGVLLVTCLLILTGFYLFPVYIMVVNALKTEYEFSMNQIALPSSLYLKNFIRAFYEMKYLRRLLNNLIVCSGYLTLLITFSSMAAYVISKKLTRFNKKLYLYFLIGVIIPSAITLYPIYVQLKAFGLINYGGLIIVYAAQAMPWAVFMYVGFMASLHPSLEESAIIDGCSVFRAFWSIMFPLVKNGTVTVVCINLLGCWNDFLMPYIFIQKDIQRTLMVSVYQYRTLYSYEYAPLFAALCLATIPFLIVFFIAQRQIMGGIAAGSVKG